MTTPIHKADFSFIFSVNIGSSFSFNLCPSDLLLVLQPSDNISVFFLHQYTISFHIWIEDTVSHDFLLLLLWLFFFWLLYYKSEENTVEYICIASTVFHSNTSLYFQSVLQVTLCPASVWRLYILLFP